MKILLKDKKGRRKTILIVSAGKTERFAYLDTSKESISEETYSSIEEIVNAIVKKYKPVGVSILGENNRKYTIYTDLNWL